MVRHCQGFELSGKPFVGKGVLVKSFDMAESGVGAMYDGSVVV